MSDSSQIYLQYIDAITIVNSEAKVVHLSRYNARFDDRFASRELQNLQNKNFFEVYPTIDPEDSTILKCLRLQKPVIRTNQTYYDYSGRLFATHNITIPILRHGELCGAIELSRDVTQIQDLSAEYSRLGSRPKTVAVKSSKHSSTDYSFDDIITNDGKMRKNIGRAKLAAPSSSPILIYGETGTGKELFAQSIHNYSSRRDKPFIAQNCGALPESLFESILFGTVPGAFTGAVDKPGLFEQANGGTLFLDEIHGMPVNLQVKLLRVLQDGRVKRIGDARERVVDVKVLSGMNVDPTEALDKGEFRRDLFYRISVVNLWLIPLRERPEDISVYIDFFIAKYNREMVKHIKGITPEVERIFFQHDWPGNVRELQHVIEGAMNIVEGDWIDVTHLPIYLNRARKKENGMLVGTKKAEVEEVRPFHEVMEGVERELIVAALQQAEGNVKNASKILKLPRQTLQYRMTKYKISPEDYEE